MKEAFAIDRINYELLGNSLKNHIHWHIIPRRTNDPGPKGPIWLRGKEQIYAEKNKPTTIALEELVQKIVSKI